MKVVVTAQGTTLDDFVDPRFGRCRYFLFVDSETLMLESANNEFAAAAGGAGIQSAQFVVERGAEAVITGSLGPNAAGVLKQAGIPAYRGAGTIASVVEKLRDGKLPVAER